MSERPSWLDTAISIETITYLNGPSIADLQFDYMVHGYYIMVVMKSWISMTWHRHRPVQVRSITMVD